MVRARRGLIELNTVNMLVMATILIAMLVIPALVKSTILGDDPVTLRVNAVYADARRALITGEMYPILVTASFTGPGHCKILNITVSTAEPTTGGAGVVYTASYTYNLKLSQASSYRLPAVYEVTGSGAGVEALVIVESYYDCGDGARKLVESTSVELNP